MNAAPLLVSFLKVETYIRALPIKQSEQYKDEIITLVEKKLPPVVSPYCLAVLFGYSLEFVHALSKNQHKFYRRFEIRQGRKTRKIDAPKVALKVIQKWFGFHLSSALEFEPHVFGFVKGLSSAKAAKLHVGARWVYSVDILNFFPSISQIKIKEALIKEGYTDNGASLLIGLCCLDGALAQGSPASPVLSNIFMRDIDKKLSELARKYLITMTRYADDIVFSGRDNFPQKLKDEVSQLIIEAGLVLNENKQYFASVDKGQRLKVHGLLVKEEAVRLTKGYRNKIRAYNHMLANGKISEKDIPRVLGHLKYAKFIDNLN
ncbi:RNA-directed DNA polymerase [Serratia fonticola]|uniref:reverse transcriptase family protein n=1 Tax=Serratia fonticola TaxID=47917 RepID=UPI0015C63A93|nr:reverse transcriptase family protein [Serratia fonticola]MBC3382035.1 RNA-directed DNA polymerase [Serratia fonticola]NYA41234.1 RNA-directed DNA polymerase [Serratia fonticola]